MEVETAAGQLCRLLCGSTTHWFTPSRALEDDLPAADRERDVATTAVARHEDVRTAARQSLRCSRELVVEAAARWSTEYSVGLHDEIGAAPAGRWHGRPTLLRTAAAPGIPPEPARSSSPRTR
ncbi:hypothetical protein ACFW1M_33590 [Streptomyces inhibens]|uniref:hypothetical protein n=1 Tax=Streptomyces inhibens TaxID=2293571 RepID=UPI0036835428